MAKKTKKHRSPTKNGGLRLKYYEQTMTPNGPAYGVTMDQYGRIMTTNEQGEMIASGDVGTPNH